MTSSLPPLPAHVLVPSDSEIEQARRIEPSGGPAFHWRQSECRICQGTRKYLMWTPQSKAGEGGELDTFECRCEDQMVLERWFAVRGIERRYWGVRLRDIYTDKMGDGVPIDGVRWLNGWLSDVANAVRYGDSVLLHGPPGSGKTLVAMLALKAALEAGITASRSLNAGSITQLDQWSNTEFREFWSSKIMRAPVLVVDDAGRESHRSKAERQDLRELILSRSANIRSTIITTNLSEKDFQSHYGGDATWRAIKDVCTIIRLARQDGRQFDVHSMMQAERRLGIMRPAVFG